MQNDLPPLPEMKPMLAAPMSAGPIAPAAAEPNERPAAFQRQNMPQAMPLGRRLRQIVGILAGGGMMMAAGVGALEMIAKPEFRPSTLIATFEARTELSGMNQRMGAEPGETGMTEAEYREKLAEAERQGQATAELAFQEQLAVIQADKERVVQAYATLYQRANMIAQAAIQMEALAQQFRQQLLQMSNGGRSMVIMMKDLFCGLGDPQACQSARTDRGTMIAEADELSRGDVGNRVRELMSGIDDPATLIANADQEQNGTPDLD